MIDNQPFFSICVPTRNRSETLYYCLKTLLHQDFESYEIIISDNCDEEESKKTSNIVKELNSPKLYYYKLERVLSMADNYEFALSKTNGKFVLCMGDDDGLIVNSLQYVFDFINKYNADIVKSPVAWYFWLKSTNYPDSLMTLPFPRPVMTVNSRSLLEKVAAFQLGYFNLPMIYYSFISRKIIDSIIAEKGNFFQNCASIDIYSGFVLAYKTKEFFIADKPFMIVGVSSKSNGAAQINNLPNIVSEFDKQHNLMESYKKYQIPLLPQYQTTTFVLLELKKFVSNYNIPNNDLKINTEKVILNFLSQQPIINNISIINFKEYFELYDIYKNDILSIEKDFLDKQVYFPFLSHNDIQLVHGEEIDPKLFGVKNVYDAAVIFRKLIDGTETLIPVEITKKMPPSQRPILFKRVFNRFNRALKVLLNSK